MRPVNSFDSREFDGPHVSWQAHTFQNELVERGVNRRAFGWVQTAALVRHSNNVTSGQGQGRYFMRNLSLLLQRDETIRLKERGGKG